MAHQSTASFFAKWYIAQLKAYPMLTNISAAIVLTTTGDVLAQELEQQAQQKSTGVSLSLKPTASATTRQHEQEHLLGSHHRQQAMGLLEESLTKKKLTEASSSCSSDLSSSPSSWDPFRTGTMVAWSVFAYTPFYVVLYRLFDRYLPKQTPTTIAARVFLSFVTSIPVNAAFYVYGSAIEATTTIQSSQEPPSETTDDNDDDVTTPNQQHESPKEKNWETMFYESVKQKLTKEFPNTMVVSGSCWVPINLVRLHVFAGWNFTFDCMKLFTGQKEELT